MTLTPVLALCAALLAPLAAAAQDLAGRYVGLEEARGMTLSLEEGGARDLRGAIDLGAGPVRFGAERVGPAAEAALTLPDGPAFLRVTPHPSGVIATIAPVGPGGVIAPGDPRAYAFVPEGTPMPELPARFLPEPDRPPRVIDAEAYVASYPFWSPRAAAWGYDAVAPRLRTVIRLFPLVQTDLLAKICRSPDRTPGIAEALSGQGVTCDAVARALAPGSAAARRLSRAAEEERAILLDALDCADDLTRTQDRCARAGRETARRAASIETVASVLRRYR